MENARKHNPNLSSTEVHEKQKKALAQYDRMCAMIKNCHDIFGVKKPVVQAFSYETLAKQTKNFESEVLAVKVRARASRELGKRLNQLGKAMPGRPKDDDEGVGIYKNG